MAILTRRTLRALALLAIAAFGFSVQQTRAQDGVSGPPMTLAMVAAPFSKDLSAPALVEPVLLCGNRWVTGTYVLGQNCRNACVNKFHSGCTAQLVNQCRHCWAQLVQCAAQHYGTPAEHCHVCSRNYAECMFHGWGF